MLFIKGGTFWRKKFAMVSHSRQLPVQMLLNWRGDISWVKKSRNQNPIKKLRRGGRICAGSKGQKYAQNMRNPKNRMGSATPYLTTHALLLQNMMIFLIRTKCLSLFKNPQGTFLIFQKKIGLLNGHKILGGPKIFIPSLSIILMGLPQKIEKKICTKYAQICANMCKYAQHISLLASLTLRHPCWFDTIFSMRLNLWCKKKLRSSTPWFLDTPPPGA